MPAWTVKSHGKAAVDTVLKGLQKARSDFAVSSYAPPRVDEANGVVWASFIIPGLQNPNAELYIEKFGDYVSMRLTGTNPNFVVDTRKTAKREGEIPATANAVTRWLQQAASAFAKKVPQLRKETMSKTPNAERLIQERLAEANTGVWSKEGKLSVMRYSRMIYSVDRKIGQIAAVYTAPEDFPDMVLALYHYDSGTGMVPTAGLFKVEGPRIKRLVQDDAPWDASSTFQWASYQGLKFENMYEESRQTEGRINEVDLPAYDMYSFTGYITFEGVTPEDEIAFSNHALRTLRRAGVTPTKMGDVDVMEAEVDPDFEDNGTVNVYGYISGGEEYGRRFDVVGAFEKAMNDLFDRSMLRKFRIKAMSVDISDINEV